MSVPGVYHHYPSKQDLLVKVLDITMMDLLWRLQHARDDGNNPIERVALVVEALALFHTRRSDLSFIVASEMRSLEPHHYRRIGRLRDDVQHLLDTEIAAAITAGDLAVNYRRDAGKAIATMCTALVQWFQADGLTTPSRSPRNPHSLHCAFWIQRHARASIPRSGSGSPGSGGGG